MFEQLCSLWSDHILSWSWDHSQGSKQEIVYPLVCVCLVTSHLITLCTPVLSTERQAMHPFKKMLLITGWHIDMHRYAQWQSCVSIDKNSSRYRNCCTGYSAAQASQVRSWLLQQFGASKRLLLCQSWQVFCQAWPNGILPWLALSILSEVSWPAPGIDGRNGDPHWLSWRARTLCFSHAPHTPVQRVQSQKEASNWKLQLCQLDMVLRQATPKDTFVSMRVGDYQKQSRHHPSRIVFGWMILSYCFLCSSLAVLVARCICISEISYTLCKLGPVWGFGSAKTYRFPQMEDEHRFARIEVQWDGEGEPFSPLSHATRRSFIALATWLWTWTTFRRMNLWRSGHYGNDMGMDQYLLIPFLMGWTSIYQLFWCSPGVQGFDTLPYSSDIAVISTAYDNLCRKR